MFSRRGVLSPVPNPAEDCRAAQSVRSCFNEVSGELLSVNGVVVLVAATAVIVMAVVAHLISSHDLLSSYAFARSVPVEVGNGRKTLRRRAVDRRGYQRPADVVGRTLAGKT